MSGSRGVLALVWMLGCAPENNLVVSDTDLVPDVFCDPAACFDEDFCTDDFCQPDGSCLHVARNAFEACQTESHCDDQNPCTVDRCDLDDCGLMRCNHAWLDGCQPCDFGCNDANPCTADSCGDDGICTFGVSDPNCDPACRTTEATGVEALQWSYYGGVTSSFIGRAEPFDGRTCAGGVCVCEGELALASGGFAVGLRGGEGGVAAPWTCSIEACEGVSAACDPLIEGVSYVVWGMMAYLQGFEQQAPQPSDAGRASDTSFDEAGGAPPGYSVDALEVAGYCLSSLPDHLPGSYAGALEADGRRASFELVIGWGPDGELVASMGACTGCAELGLVERQEIELAPSDWTAVTLPVTLTEGAVTARLYPRSDRFIGDLRLTDGRFAGTLSLERLPP